MKKIITSVAAVLGVTFISGQAFAQQPNLSTPTTSTRAKS